MSQRRRRVRVKAVRSRVARAKVLRRRARGAGARRGVTAMTAAAVTLAGVGATPGTTARAEGAQTVGVHARNAGVPLLACDPRTPPSDPRGLVDVGGTLFFSADDGTHGRELWTSDGTLAGTVLIKDIRSNHYHYYSSDPSSLVDVGGTLFFTATDNTHGRELWTSDGTRAGTVLVRDIATEHRYGYDFASPSGLVDVGGMLFFTVDDDFHGRELWTSDGTRAGTVLVKDIRPSNHYDYFGSDPSSLVEVGGTLFFSANDGTHGRELWTSDGTRAGTVLVKDINPGAGHSSSSPSKLVDVGGRLFFSADDGSHGDELWTSDGTEAGTVLVKDIAPGDYDSSLPWDLVDVAGTLFFAADDDTHGTELWTSDGTEAGTVLVKNIHPADGRGSLPHSLTDIGGSLFFSAKDRTHGHELWTSDGTRAGTVMVKDINLDHWFRIAGNSANTSRGTMKVFVRIAGDGRLVARPVAGSLLRKSVVDVASAGQTTIVLRPTRAGMRILRQKGTLRVRARFTFTPCGGTASSVIRRYTLQLK